MGDLSGEGVSGDLSGDNFCRFVRGMSVGDLFEIFKVVKALSIYQGRSLEDFSNKGHERMRLLMCFYNVNKQLKLK